MARLTDDFYCNVITQVFPDAANIRKPNIMGHVSHRIFIADLTNKTVICKFNDKDIVLHNKHICDILCKYNIPVPHTEVYKCRNTWFEAYEYNHNKTLYEHIKNGLCDEDILHAYKSAISTQKDIANIFTTYEKDRYFDIIKLYDIPFYKKLLYRLSLPGKQLMLHNDLQPKNILYSPETKQISLIDMDSIGCSNFGFFMLRFFNYYPQNNKKIIYNEVAKIFNRRLNPVTLNTLFAIQKIKTVFQRIK